MIYQLSPLTWKMSNAIAMHQIKQNIGRNMHMDCFKHTGGHYYWNMKEMFIVENAALTFSEVKRSFNLYGTTLQHG